MRCPRCNDSGVIDLNVGDTGQTVFNKCDSYGCKHTHKYYIFIKERYSNQPKGNVIHVDFKRRKREEECK